MEMKIFYVSLVRDLLGAYLAVEAESATAGVFGAGNYGR